MFSNTLLIFALAGNVVKGGYGQQKPLADHAKGPLTPQFDALVQETMDHLHVPGLSVAVVVGNETYAKVYIVFSGSISTSRLLDLNLLLRATEYRAFRIKKQRLIPYIILHQPPSLSPLLQCPC